MQKNGFRSCLLESFWSWLAKMSLQESLHFKKDFLSLEYFDVHSLPIFLSGIALTVISVVYLGVRRLLFSWKVITSHKSHANTIHHISHQVILLILHDPKLIFSGRNNFCTVDVFQSFPVSQNTSGK